MAPGALEAGLRDALAAAGSTGAVAPGGAWAVSGPQPLASVRPVDEAGVRAVVDFARSQRLALVPRGGGSQDAWGGPLRRPAVLLDTTALAGIVRHAPGDLTIRLRAGTRLDWVRAALRPHGQELALAPAGASAATVGGVVAGDAWGPTRLAHGGPRDLTLGLRVVDGAGRAFQTGGDVVKNVSGLDIGKLFVGSFGTLGVVTEASFKLRPLPARRTAWAAVWDDGDGVWSAAGAASGAEVVPAACAIVPAPPGWGLVLLLEGSGAEVAEQTAWMEALAGTALWSAAEDLDPAGGPSPPADAGRAASLLAAGFAPAGPAPRACVRCEVPDARLRELWTEAAGVLSPGAESAPPGAPRATAWPGLGTLWVAWGVGGPPPSALAALRRLAEDLGGRAVATAAGAGDARDIPPWGDAGELLPLLRRIKARFDPDGILSPGRFVDGI